MRRNLGVAGEPISRASPGPGVSMQSKRCTGGSLSGGAGGLLQEDPWQHDATPNAADAALCGFALGRGCCCYCRRMADCRGFKPFSLQSCGVASLYSFKWGGIAIRSLHYINTPRDERDYEKRLKMRPGMSSPRSTDPTATTRPPQAA